MMPRHLAPGQFVLYEGDPNYPQYGPPKGTVGRVLFIGRYGGVSCAFAPRGKDKLVGQNTVRILTELEALAYADQWAVEPPTPRNLP